MLIHVGIIFLSFSPWFYVIASPNTEGKIFSWIFAGLGVLMIGLGIFL